MMTTLTQSRSDRAGAFAALARSPELQIAARLFQLALAVTVAGALVLVAVATVPILFGYHTYVIEGASMEPALKVGSVAVTKPTTPEELRVGDIIAYRRTADAPSVLHRIVEMNSVDGQLQFVTQGDQNESPDVEPVQLAGRGDLVLYSVPYAGYILNFANSWPGRAALIGVPLLGIGTLLLRGSPPRPEPRQRPEAAAREPGSATLQPAHTADVRLVLSGLPSLDTLIRAVEALRGLPAVAEAVVAALRDDEAAVELTLRDRLTPAEVVRRLRDTTGFAVIREEAPPGQPHLRFLVERAADRSLAG
jgi:signal peptidase